MHFCNHQSWVVPRSFSVRSTASGAGVLVWIHKCEKSPRWERSPHMGEQYICWCKTKTTWFFRLLQACFMHFCNHQIVTREWPKQGKNPNVISVQLVQKSESVWIKSCPAASPACGGNGKKTRCVFWERQAPAWRGWCTSRSTVGGGVVARHSGQCPPLQVVPSPFVL